MRNIFTYARCKNPTCNHDYRHIISVQFFVVFIGNCAVSVCEHCERVYISFTYAISNIIFKKNIPKIYTCMIQTENNYSFRLTNILEKYIQLKKMNLKCVKWFLDYS